MKREVENLANNLRDLVGVISGDVVGICSENNIHIDTVVIAVWILGGAVAPLNPCYTVSELII